MHALACLASITILLGFLRPEIIRASSFTFSGAPSTIHDETPFEVDVQLATGDSNKQKVNYLRAVFFAADSTKYFGYTQSASGEWGNSASQKDTLFAITLNEEGSWSGKIRSKVDLNSSYYNDSGTYYFKVGRYTSEADTSAQWSDNATSILITAKFSPTPEPPPKPSATPKAAPTSNNHSDQSSTSPTSIEASTAPSPQKISVKPTLKVLGASSSSRFLKTGIIKPTPITIATINTSSTDTPKPLAAKPSLPIIGLLASGLGLSFAGLFPWIKKLSQWILEKRA
jgi:hypothetical protein